MLKYRKKYQKRMTASKDSLIVKLQNMANQDPHMTVDEFRNAVLERHKVVMTDEFAEYLLGKRDKRPERLFSA